MTSLYWKSPARCRNPRSKRTLCPMTGASPTKAPSSAATAWKRGALRTSASLMPVSPEINSGMCLLGLMSDDHSSSTRRPLNLTAPISIMASRSTFSPVVSISMVTMDCIIEQVYHKLILSLQLANLGLNPSIHKPFLKLCDLLIVCAKILNAIAHNSGSLLKRHIQLFDQLASSACVDNEDRFILQDLIEILLEHRTPPQQRQRVLINVACRRFAPCQKIHNTFRTNQQHLIVCSSVFRHVSDDRRIIIVTQDSNVRWVVDDLSELPNQDDYQDDSWHPSLDLLRSRLWDVLHQGCERINQCPCQDRHNRERGKVVMKDGTS